MNDDHLETLMQATTFACLDAFDRYCKEDKEISTYTAELNGKYRLKLEKIELSLEKEDV